MERAHGRAKYCIGKISHPTIAIAQNNAVIIVGITSLDDAPMRIVYMKVYT